MAQVIELDITGAFVAITSAQAERLRDVAAAETGRAHAHRDRSLLLERSLRARKRVVLQRGEKRALDEILAREEFSELRPTLSFE